MRKFLSALIIFTATPALAVTANAPKELSGVWSTKDGCMVDVKRAKDPNYWPKNFEDMMFLTPDGIEGYEWSCQFLDKKPNKLGQTVITASCSAEGDSWPELLLLEYYAPDGWRVINRVDKNINVNIFPQECKP